TWHIAECARTPGRQWRAEMSTQAPPGHRPAAAHPGWAGAAPNEWRPAGFWRRTGAALLDMLVIGVGIAIALGVIGGVAGRRASAVDRGDPGSLVLAAASQAVGFRAPLAASTGGC